MFNLSLEEGIVPSEWKEANITPLFKKGSRKKPEHYRPVSLTSVVCKLLETLIRDHMVEFLVKYKLINTSPWPQSRSKNSTVFAELGRSRSKNSTVFAELDQSLSKNSTVFAELDRSRSKNSTVFAELGRSRSKNSTVFTELDIILLVV